MYKGDISPLEAWSLLESDPKAVLIDVRTPPEWAYSGYPILPNMENINLRLSWRLYPTMEVNEKFVDSIESEVPEKDRVLLFLCRTGGRSADAAAEMTKAGFENCYNIEDGFDGVLDQNHQRGKVNGWKFNKLAWEQS